MIGAPSPQNEEFRPGTIASAAELLLAALLATFFFTSFLLVPLLGAFGLPFAGVPAVRLTHRRGMTAGLLACAICAGLLLGIGLAAGSGAFSLALLAGAVTGLPVVAAASVRRGISPSRAFLLLSVAGLLLIAVLLPVLGAGDRSIEAEIGSSFDQMIASAVESYSRTNAGPETIDRVRGTLTASRRLAQEFWIGLLGASWTLAAAISFYAGARFARPAPSGEAARFEKLRMPAPVAALFVLAGGGAALLSGAARNAAGNLLVPLSALYFVAGLSIICYFARRWFRLRVLRIGLYALVVYFPMNVGVALLGLFDWYADFRSRDEGGRDKS